MGPEGGDKGGRVVASGTPEDVAATPGSYTGEFLKELLARQRGTYAKVLEVPREAVAMVAERKGLVKKKAAAGKP